LQNDGKVAELFGGYPVVFSEALPSFEDAAASQPYIVCGDFSGYMLNFPEGRNRVQLIRDPFTLMHSNQVRYLSEIYAAGNITVPKSFVKITK
jgi:HK97 family phage major capsid protein